MTAYFLKHDLELLYVRAASFPAGILAAHEQLHSKIHFTTERKYYGISFPGADGQIIYIAAAEKLDDNEDVETGLEVFVLKKGQYACITVHNYMSNTAAIGEAFQQLLQHPQLDTQGACVEWYYSNEDVQCMVRLTETNTP